MSKRPTRKPNRLQGFDYAANGAYFVTVCAANRAPLFGKIVGATALGRPPQMEFTELGKCVEKTISLANKDNIVIDQYVVMPNHIHMMIVLRSEAGDRGRSPLQFIVRNMKSYVTKWAGFPVWQKSFHDHIIRNQDEYAQIAEYIKHNPLLWEDDCFFVERATALGRPFHCTLNKESP